MKKTILLLICILAVSCQKKEPIAQGDLPFFLFDQIDYYHKTISEDSIIAIIQKEDQTRKEQGLLQIIKGNVPVNTMDTLCIKNMDILGFEKQSIPKAYFDKINNLFSLKTAETKSATACVAIYRDVLVFRKKDKVIGVAKICFDCEKSAIVGARYDASQFGQSGEYKALQEILLKVK